MSEKNKIVIPTKSYKIHNNLKEELIQDYNPIPRAQFPLSPVRTPSKTQSLYDKIARAGYFRPKLNQDSESPIQPLNVYPNYLKRDPREYPPIHCCPIKPRASVGDGKAAQEIYAKTKYVHHTLFDAGKYANSTESPTVKSMNKTVFGKTIATPINLLSTDSMQFDSLQLREKQQTVETEIPGQNEENPLHMSGITSMSKVAPSSNNFECTRESRRRFKSGDARAEKFQEKFEANQNDFRKTQIRINEIAKKRRSWYQENMEEKTRMLQKMKEGGLLLKSMNSANHREEIRHAVRLSLVHNRYEKDWQKLGVISRDKKLQQESSRPITSKLKNLLIDNKIEMSRIVSKTPDPVHRRQGSFF